MPRSPRARTGNLRLVDASNSPSARSSSRDKPLAYTNRLGRTYYLHQGTTKTGKPRYFVARSIRAKALFEMPTGFEFTESINGVVSVRRIAESETTIPESDVELVRSALLQHEHLERHQVHCISDEIVIYEPREVYSDSFLSETFGLISTQAKRRIADFRQRSVKYDPVMKFVPALSTGEVYAAFRMSYRGEGGWHQFAIGDLEKLAGNYVWRIGTDELFEIM
jgi:hypothetical protein